MSHDGASTDAGIIAFRCDPKLRDALERMAAAEGLSTSAVARRACLRDIAQTERRREGAAP